MTKEGKYIRVRFEPADFLLDLAPEPKPVLEIRAGASVEEAVAEAARQFGPKFSEALFDRSGRLYTHIMVLLDGEHLPWSEIGNTALDKDCRLGLVPMIYGG